MDAKKYEVALKTVSGMFAQYETTITVFAFNEDDVVEKAFQKLKHGAFSDYSRSMWQVLSVCRCG